MANLGSEPVKEVARLKRKIEAQEAERIEIAIKHAEEVVELKQTIEDQKSKQQTELKARILENSVLSKKVDKLEKAAKTIEGAGLFGKLVQLAKVSKHRLILDLYRKNVDFDFELCDLNAFLKSKAYRSSDYFFAGGLAWYLGLEPAEKDEIEYLSIDLYAEDYAGSDGGNWHVKVGFSVSIVNQSNGREKTHDLTGDFSKAMSGWGLDKFISIKDLRDDGYVRDNKIRVQASLEVVGDLIRTE